MYHDPMTQAVAHYGSTENEEVSQLETEIERLKKAIEDTKVELRNTPTMQAAGQVIGGGAAQKLISLQQDLKRAEGNLRLAKLKRDRNPYVSGAMFLLSATAMAVSYSRNQSILKSFGAGLVSVPYLIYVAIDSRKN